MAAYRTKVIDGTAYVSRGRVAMALNRSPRTTFRFQQRGVLPKPTHWSGDPSVPGSRRAWWPLPLVELYENLGEQSGLVYNQRRSREFRSLLLAEAHRRAQGRTPAPDIPAAPPPSGNDTEPVRLLDDALQAVRAPVPWNVLSESTMDEPERAPAHRSWSEVVGEPQLQTVSSRCHCGRYLTYVTIQDRQGRLRTYGTCDSHGPQVG
jgi:hypothetical protein